MLPAPKEVTVSWSNYYHIIPSMYPPINFFEGLVDPQDMEVAWFIESLTNDRLREETGNIFLVDKKDQVCGKGASIVMAAFTHIGRSSRFTDGSYGIYYAGNSLQTSVKETIYHREKFLQSTHEAPGEIAMRVYKGIVNKQLHDIRDDIYVAFHHPDSYVESQQFGQELKEKKAWGIIYKSVRHDGGECLAALRPPAISIPHQTKHLGYVWNGKNIAHVYEKKMLDH